jgi:hypothetical protein
MLQTRTGDPLLARSRQEVPRDLHIIPSVTIIRSVTRARLVVHLIVFCSGSVLGILVNPLAKLLLDLLGKDVDTARSRSLEEYS